MTERNSDFTQGRILTPLIMFAAPVLLAIFLQAMYGAVDLLVVGKFAGAGSIAVIAYKCDNLSHSDKEKGNAFRIQKITDPLGQAHNKQNTVNTVPHLLHAVKARVLFITRNQSLPPGHLC